MADLTQSGRVKLLHSTGISTFTANGAIVAGNPFTAHPTSGFAKADANATGLQAIFGIAVTSADDGETFAGHIRPGEVIDIGATGMSPGVVYYVSNTAGGICPFADLASGSRPIMVGTAETSSTFRALYVANATDL